MNMFLATWWNNIVKLVSNAFSNAFEGLGLSIVQNIVMSVLVLLMFAILIIVRIVKNAKTAEITTDNAVNRINSYLDKNPFVTEENLVEFNRMMLNSTKPIKFQWQQYVLERKGKPSDFLSEENCITKPLRTNSYQQGIKNFMLSSIGLFLFSVILIFASNFASAGTAGGNLLLYLISPIIGLIIAIIYASICSVLNNAYMVDLYYSFTTFTKKIDRAVENMPEDIDHEILFTPKEIKAGIPVLQEYLRKRSIEEQEQIRKSREREVEHENYNFDALGVDGSLVMDRVMKESETYLGNKKRIDSAIEMVQAEKDTVTKDYEEENKTYQRNLRDIREEIKSLKNKLETVSDEITRSSLRRQQKAEVEKEQSIEAQIDKSTSDYNKKIATLDAEIDEKRKEVEHAKQNVVDSLIEEFNNFADKTYTELTKVANEKVADHVKQLETEKDEVYALLEEKEKIFAEKIAIYEDKNATTENLEEEIKRQNILIDDLQSENNELKTNYETINSEYFQVSQELESRRKELAKKDDILANYKKNKTVEVYRYFDFDGREFYFDENNQPYYIDENGERVYYAQSADNEVMAEEVAENDGNVTTLESNELVEPIESETSEEERPLNEDAEPVETEVVEEEPSEEVSSETIEENGVETTESEQSTDEEQVTESDNTTEEAQLVEGAVTEEGAQSIDEEQLGEREGEKVGEQLPESANEEKEPLESLAQEVVDKIKKESKKSSKRKKKHK